MLTLPSEISDNKNLIAYEPILFIEFFDIPYFVATRTYEMDLGVSGSDGEFDSAIGLDVFQSTSATFVTDGVKAGQTLNVEGTLYTITDVDSETRLQVDPSASSSSSGLSYAIYESYKDLMDKSYDFNISISIPQAINGISSTAAAGFQLLDWRSTLRSDLIGSNPDLTDSIVNLYLKFHTSNALKSNTTRLHTGKVSNWSTAKDKMTIKLKNFGELNALPNLPTDLLSDTYDRAGIDKTRAFPIQFGDFSLDKFFEYWSEFGDNLACCPYVQKVDGKYRVIVADHKMHEMPTVTELTNDSYNPHCFMLKNDLFIAYALKSADTVITNDANGCYIDFGDFLSARGLAYLPPTDEYTGDFARENEVTDWENAVDGSTSTSCTVDWTDEAMLSLHEFKVEKCDGINITGGVDFNVSIDFGAINISGDGNIQVGIRNKNTLSDHATVYTVYSYYADSMRLFGWTHLDDTLDLDDWAVYVMCTGTSGDADCVIKNLIVNVEVEGPDIGVNQELFIKAKGKEYSGTWNSRKTAGDLIQNPADALESILRDYLDSEDSDIDTNTFDDVHSIFNSVEVRGTIMTQRTATQLLTDFCTMFNTALIKSIVGKWRLIFPKASGLNFSHSKTSTPGNEDIFTDTDSLVLGKYEQHPIDKGSFTLKRNAEKEVFSKVLVNFGYNLGSYHGKSASGSGNDVKTVNNYLLGESTSADALASLILTWVSTQKSIVSFKTYYNALAHELGDVINVRHGDLVDAFLSATVNTQKWLLYSSGFHYHPAKMDLTAIELL